MVVPTTKKIEYVIDMKRVILRKLKLGIADGVMKADGQVIYTATDLRVGLFEAGRARRPRSLNCATAAARNGRTTGHARRNHSCDVSSSPEWASSPRSATAPRKCWRRCAKASPASSRAEKYKELGFRCQVHGEPQLDWEAHGAAQAEAVHERRHGAGTTSPWIRRSATPGSTEKDVSERAHRHHHGLGRTVDASPSSRPPTSPRKSGGPKKIGPFEVPKAMCSGPSGVLATAFQVQGRQLLDLVGLRDLGALHRQCHRADPVGQAGRDVRRWLRGTRLDAVEPVRRHGRDVVAGSTPRRPRASRAYDKDRDGFVIAGGAGVVVLEELRARQGARRQDLWRDRRLRRDLGRLRHGRTLGRRRRALHAAGAAGFRRHAASARSTTSTRTPPRRRSATRARSTPSGTCSARTFRRSPPPSR